jgi:hypothetical protein
MDALLVSSYTEATVKSNKYVCMYVCMYVQWLWLGWLITGFMEWWLSVHGMGRCSLKHYWLHKLMGDHNIECSRCSLRRLLKYLLQYDEKHGRYSFPIRLSSYTIHWAGAERWRGFADDRCWKLQRLKPTVPKVRMKQGICSADPLMWIKFQHTLKMIQMRKSIYLLAH